MPDFIYTLDSEPESDVEVNGSTDAATKTAGPSSAAAAGDDVKKLTTRLAKSKIVKSGDKKSATKSSRSDGAQDEEEEEGPAPTIDPSFNFDLGGGSFFDGLGGGDDFGMGADEVVTGTKPVCIRIIRFR